MVGVQWGKGLFEWKESRRGHKVQNKGVVKRRNSKIVLTRPGYVVKDSMTPGVVPVYNRSFVNGESLSHEHGVSHTHHFPKGYFPPGVRLFRTPWGVS